MGTPSPHEGQDTAWSFIHSAFTENLLLEPAPGRQGTRQGPDPGISWLCGEVNNQRNSAFLKETFTEQLEMPALVLGTHYFINLPGRQGGNNDPGLLTV